MDFAALVVSISSIFVSTIIGLLLKNYLPNYFSEKAKNLAKKQDIEILTEKVESVKSKYTVEIEKLKADLEKASHVGKMQFEVEFQIYKDVWEQLVKLKRKTLSLRPAFDVALSENESEEDRKKERVINFVEAYNQLLENTENNKPFYPPEIWSELATLLKVAWSEAVSYRFNDNKNDWKKYWEEAEKNKNKITEQIDKICETIRERIDSYKSISM